jgi:hypothetical protein
MRSYCAHINASHSPTRALRIQARHVEEEHNARVKIIAIQKSLLSLAALSPTKTKERTNSRGSEKKRKRKKETAKQTTEKPERFLDAPSKCAFPSSKRGAGTISRT